MVSEIVIKPYIIDWVQFFSQTGDGIAIGALACVITGLTGVILSKFIKIMMKG